MKELQKNNNDTNKQKKKIKLSLDGDYGLLNDSPIAMIKDDERVLVSLVSTRDDDVDVVYDEGGDDSRRAEKKSSRSAERKRKQRARKRIEKKIEEKTSIDSSSSESSSSSSSSTSEEKERNERARQITAPSQITAPAQITAPRYEIKEFEKSRAQKTFGRNNALVDWPKNDKDWEVAMPVSDGNEKENSRKGGGNDYYSSKKNNDKKKKKLDYGIVGKSFYDGEIVYPLDKNYAKYERFELDENDALADVDALAAWMRIFRCDEDVDEKIREDEEREEDGAMKRVIKVTNISNVVRGDILAYKTLAINETDGTPEVSKWLRGSVVNVDVENKIIKLRPNPEDRATSAGRLWFTKRLAAPPPYQPNGLLEAPIEDFVEIICIGGRSIWEQLDKDCQTRDVPKELGRNGAGKIPPSGSGIKRGYSQDTQVFCTKDLCQGKEMHTIEECLEGLTAEELEKRGMILLSDEENAANGGYRYFVRPENAFGQVLENHQNRRFSVPEAGKEMNVTTTTTTGNEYFDYIAAQQQQQDQYQTWMDRSENVKIPMLQEELNVACGRPSSLPRDWRTSANAKPPLPQWAKPSTTTAKAVEPTKEELAAYAAAAEENKPSTNATNNNNNCKKGSKKKYLKSSGLNSALNMLRSTGELV